MLSLNWILKSWWLLSVWRSMPFFNPRAIWRWCGLNERLCHSQIHHSYVTYYTHSKVIRNYSLSWSVKRGERVSTIEEANISRSNHPAFISPNCAFLCFLSVAFYARWRSSFSFEGAWHDARFNMSLLCLSNYSRPSSDAWEASRISGSQTRQHVVGCTRKLAYIRLWIGMHTRGA